MEEQIYLSVDVDSLCPSHNRAVMYILFDPVSSVSGFDHARLHETHHDRVLSYGVANDAPQRTHTCSLPPSNHEAG